MMFLRNIHLLNWKRLGQFRRLQPEAVAQHVTPKMHAGV